MRVNPLRLLIVAAVTAAVGVKILFWLRDGGPPARPERPSGTAVISGLIQAPDGQPVAGADVRVHLLGPGFGWRTASLADGTFTLPDMPAGEFYLWAGANGFLRSYYGETGYGLGMKRIVLAEGGRADDIRVALPRAGRVEGLVFDEGGAPAARAFVRLLRIDVPEGVLVTAQQPPRNTGPDGAYEFGDVPPGEYVVMAATDPSRQTWTYAPSAAGRDTATRLAIGPGDRRTGVDVHTRNLRTTSVRVRVVRPDGSTTPATVRLSGDGVFAGRALRTTDAQGVLSFDGIPAGRYDVVAYKGTAAPAGEDAAPPGSWGHAVVTTDGRRPIETTVTIEQGVSFAGRIELKSMEGRARPDLENARSTSLSLDAADPFTRLLLEAGREKIVVRGDGTFTALGLPAGRYAFWGFSQGGWAVVDARDADGRALHVPFELSAERAPQGVVVTMTDRSSGVSGTVTDAAGAPVPDQPVAVFAADPSPWLASNGRGRSDGFAVYIVRTDGRGRFSAQSLLAGDYLIALVPEQPRDAWPGPERWREWSPGATRVSLGPGERATVEIRGRPAGGAR